MGKWGIILNPHAGRGRAQQALPALLYALHAAGVPLTMHDVVKTTGPGTAPHLTRQMIEEHGYDGIIAAGGDGTIHEVVNGIIASKQAGSRGAALGIVALGTGNDFVKSLYRRTPLSMQQIANKIAADSRHTIDIGKITVANTSHSHAQNPDNHDDSLSCYFMDDVGLGIYAHVAAESLVKTRLKLTGIAVYIRAVLWALATHRPIPLTLHYNGHSYERLVLLACIANGRYQGAIFCLTPHAQLDDGKLDVCTIDAIPLWDILRHLPGAMRGTHTQQPQVCMAQTTHITITSEQPLLVSTDGEFIARQARHITIQIVPQALDILL